MNDFEHQYLNLLRKVKEQGVYSKNRTGINTYKIWGAQMHIDLQQGFPLLTTKKMHWKSVVHELLWMIAGDTNIQYLLKNGVTFWTEWPYQKYKNWFETKGGNISIYGKREGGCRSASLYTQKEFEQEILNNDEFAKEWGSIGQYGYGGLWRKFPYLDRDDIDYDYVPNTYIDQLSNLIRDLKTNPDSRRMIISVWHPYHSNRKEDALLPGCHNYIQFGTEELTVEERISSFKKSHFDLTDGIDQNDPKNLDLFNIPKYRLNCYFNMRASDTFLGLPFNCAFYALFTHLVANHVNMIPSQLVYSAADVHLYENHLNQVDLQLSRTPKVLPCLNIKAIGKSIFDIKSDDFEITNYDPYPAIKGDVAV
jgi:thymidylate synthase